LLALANFTAFQQLKINGAPFDDKDDENFAKTVEEICEMGDEGVEDLEITAEFAQSLLKLFQSQAVNVLELWRLINFISDPKCVEKAQRDSR
jgi:hypothetical protein